MAGFEVGAEGGETDGGCDGDEGVAVGGRGEEVEEGGEEEAGGFFFGGEAEQLGVEGEDLLFSVRVGDGGLVFEVWLVVERV